MLFGIDGGQDLEQKEELRGRRFEVRQQIAYQVGRSVKFAEKCKDGVLRKRKRMEDMDDQGY